MFDSYIVLTMKNLPGLEDLAGLFSKEPLRSARLSLPLLAN
jgi:hypothetical protein